MKLLHLANCNSTNIGNGALILGTEQVLTDDLSQNVIFTREPWDDYTVSAGKQFDQDFVNLINNYSDGLIVGAAVTLHGLPQYRNAGLRFDLPLELWSKIDKPTVLYAVSYRAWPNQIYHNLERLKRTMHFILSNSRILFSVRNDGTKAWLESTLGYNSDQIKAIPDPALYVPSENSWHPELEKGKINILLALNSEDEMHRYRNGVNSFGANLRERLSKYIPAFLGKEPGWSENKWNCLRLLAQAIEKLSQSHDLNLILCPHSHEDYKMMGEFISLCSSKLKNQVVVSCGQARVSRTIYFYDLYAKADAVISMRVHSMSPAVGLGTPLIALVSQPRMSEFMKDAGLEQFAVSVFDPELGEKVHNLLVSILQERKGVCLTLEAARHKMRERTRAFNLQVNSLYTNSV